MSDMRQISDRRFTGWILTGLLCVPSGWVAADQTLDQVIAKHVEARGGATAWGAVESMQLKGDYTAFSETHPFTLSRQRNGTETNYHMDGHLGAKRRIIGWDGEQAWWCDEWTGQIDWPARISKVTEAVMRQDAEMATPFFNWQARGFEVRLSGPEDLEGTDTVKLELTRPSGEQETWFLDAETYLEVARDATTDEFNQAYRGRMFFDDFRAVPGPAGDLVIPHTTEVEWATRHRVMEISEVVINPELDPSLFRMPPPPGMSDLLSLVGRWKVEVEERETPDGPFQTSQGQAEVVADFDRTLVRERVSLPDGDSIETLWGFDRYHNTYRAVRSHAGAPRLNVLEGAGHTESSVENKAEGGRLTVSNIETGTSYSLFGMTVHERISLFDITGTSFRVEQEMTLDGGASWMLLQKLTYSRVE